jgi:hypothetical protein
MEAEQKTRYSLNYFNLITAHTELVEVLSGY